MTEYEKFKKLLEYFVTHLEWLINNDTNNRGYNLYLKPLIDKNEFYSTGQGYNNGNIQKHISDWCQYENGDIFINIQPNYGNYKTVKCYLNWADTGLNIIARWNDNTINSLALEEYQFWLKPTKRIDLGFNKTITELGLFDNNTPNEILKELFNKFEKLIIDWNINEQNEAKVKKLQPYIDLLKSSKNIILTGAPGTGKTYLAKQIAKQLIGVKTDEELEESGQFNFVQFHPSYDYTDFVEGLRPTPPDENGVIGFEIKDGIFKSFCDKALQNLVDSEKTPDEIQSESNIVSILDNFLADSIENGEKFDYNNNSNQFVIAPHSKKEECFYAKILNNESMERQLVFKKDAIEVLKKADDVKKPTDIQKVFNTRFKYQYTFIFLILEQLRDKLKKKAEEPRIKINKKDFIFVIDEINRGEISKIFGELFFSIDPSYRGKKGAVKTQYSNLHNDENEVFYVPENVYIIGSMNDIDRSVESFDFAMRRRFIWIEITAEQSADNMDLPQAVKERMLKLNEQISKTDGLNPSYHIGAAYFLDSNGNARLDIENIWNLRIEPLLKEYLRGMPDSIEKIELLKTAFTE
ncbi:MAG: AAA family ATPase [Prolixibacteraceae bacterium]|nr:AAA family ATPase [Prolixibacteraceae bacterium]